MAHTLDRRTALKAGLAAAVGVTALAPAMTAAQRTAPPFKISLAQWSLHRALQAGTLDHLDFARTAKEDYGIDAVEYVNTFFKDKAKDVPYLSDMVKRAADLGVKSLLIMCDGEGQLGDADESKRAQTIENHRKWLDAASALGCHSIRVNAQSSGNFDEQMARAADGLRRLTELGVKQSLNVIVENHGGLSSNGAWLSAVIRKVNHPRCGTLPDFGNFSVNDTEKYDRYKGVEEMMPYAKAVSAKSHDFNNAGEETHTDYARMLGIVFEAGYRGHVGIEYEGEKMSEPEGIRATKKLIERVMAGMALPAGSH